MSIIGFEKWIKILVLTRQMVACVTMFFVGSLGNQKTFLELCGFWWLFKS